jgi:tRNA threonylcarbamoyladenosine biosynthesis protein TsaE
MNFAPNAHEWLLADEAATLALGAAFAPALSPGLRLFLEGDLGAGKTTFVRGLLRALGHEGRVRSPTYALCERYALQPPVGSIEFKHIAKIYFYHFDFYRLNSPHDWLEAGFREAFESAGVCAVEWPANAGPTLPAPDLVLHFEHRGNEPESGRRLTVEALSDAGIRCLTRVARTMPMEPPAPR